MKDPTTTIEQVLQESRDGVWLLDAGDLAGRWRTAFGEAASRVPEPYWLYADDEQTPLVLGYPLKISTVSWIPLPHRSPASERLTSPS